MEDQKYGNGQYFCARCQQFKNEINRFKNEINRLKDYIAKQEQRIINLKCEHSDSIDYLQKEFAKKIK